MKRNYVRPEAFYESYKLSQHIAKCGWKMRSGDITTCTAYQDFDFNKEPDPNSRLLFQEGVACTVDKDECRNYCYTTGTSDMYRAFNS